MSYICDACGALNNIAVNAGRCGECNYPLSLAEGESFYKYPKQAACHTIVGIAVRAGILPRLDGLIPCADCGKPAEIYEHRDYMKPLDVQPNCQACNVNKPRAKNHD